MIDTRLNRRAVLGAIGLAAMTSLARPVLSRASAKGFFAMHDLPIGVQLYTVDALLNEDFEGTLSQIAGMGYRTVEIAGFHKRSAGQFRAALDTAGLTCRSAHIPAQALDENPSLASEPGPLAEALHVLGVKTVVMPIFPLPASATSAPSSFETFVAAGRAMTADDWKRTADYINAKARVFAELGLGFAYHNHNFEFAPLGDTCGFDILLNGTDPHLVTFEMDAGWVTAAGRNPLTLLRDHPARFRQIHVKDIKASTRPNFDLKQDPTSVGAGMIDWKAILPAAYADGVREFYVEQEPPYIGGPLPMIAASQRYLASLPA